MEPSLEVYAFCEPRLGKGERTVVCIGHANAIQPFMMKNEIADRFGGYVCYRDSKDQEFVGVWGKRNGSRLRRFLRERGALLVLHEFRPDDVHISHSSAQGKRPRSRDLLSQVS